MIPEEYVFFKNIDDHCMRPPHAQTALEGLGSGMLGTLTVRRKAVASETVAQADTFQWTVVFLSKVSLLAYWLNCLL